jgi:hypothetical protein
VRNDDDGPSLLRRLRSGDHALRVRSRSLPSARRSLRGRRNVLPRGLHGGRRRGPGLYVDLREGGRRLHDERPVLRRNVRREPPAMRDRRRHLRPDRREVHPRNRVLYRVLRARAVQLHRFGALNPPYCRRNRGRRRP